MMMMMTYLLMALIVQFVTHKRIV